MERAVGLVITLAYYVFVPTVGLIANTFIYRHLAKKHSLNPHQRWRSTNFMWSIFLVSLIVELVIGVLIFGY